MKVTIKKALRIDVIFSWRKSEAGYVHVPFLYLAFGRNGFTADILFIQATVSWGGALKTSLLNEQKQKENSL